MRRWVCLRGLSGRHSREVRAAKTFAIIRLIGATTWAHAAPRQNLALAQPPMLHSGYARSASGHARVRGIQSVGIARIGFVGNLRTTGSQSPAAYHYARTPGQLSGVWDWAVQSLNMSVHQLLVRANPSANPPHVRDIAPIPTPKPAEPAPEMEISREINNHAAA